MDDFLAGNKTPLMLHGAEDGGMGGMGGTATGRVACGVIGTG